MFQHPQLRGNAHRHPRRAEVRAGRNGHNSLFYSLEALDYADEINEIGARIDEQYDYDAPEEVLREYYASVDKFRVKELDQGFMESILTFYRDAVK